MLFRRFLLVSTLIALSGIALLQLISATHPQHRDFQVSKRLEEWKAHEDRQFCKANHSKCVSIAQVSTKR